MLEDPIVVNAAAKSSSRSGGKPTSFDIAQLAGVSQPTVSRALRGSSTVNLATRQRIEAIARQLNYTVDRSASNLRNGTTKTIALLLFRDPTPDETVEPRNRRVTIEVR